MSFKFKFFSISLTLLFTLFFLLTSKSVLSDTDFTLDAELSLFPSTGTIDQGDDFVVDVLIDTKGEEVVLVRAVLWFDSELVQLNNVVENEDLFCDWPVGEQLLDNETGLVMVTGFCQSGGEDDLYATVGEPDVFARFEFTAVEAGELTMEWQYSGFDEPMESVIISDGSPPQNILLLEGDDLTYTYTIEPPPEKMPETNISALENISSTFWLGGSIFALAFLTNILLDPKRRYFGKSRTIVVYDDKE